jgi:FkbM family methyltransferase
VDEHAFHRALFRPGLVLDIGAHDGLLTLKLAALHGARVHAFEPLPAAFARLSAAVAAAPAAVRARIALHAEALGEAAGTAVLEVPSVGGVAQEQWASMVKDYTAIRAADPRVDAIARHAVPVRRLDDLGLAGVRAIKLDVEGAEAEVIRGGAATIRACRPAMSVEIEERHRPGSTRAVPALLAELGLEGFFALDGAWHGIGAFDAARMQRASPSPASFEASDPYVFVFYFVPPERRGELLALPA